MKVWWAHPLLLFFWAMRVNLNLNQIDWSSKCSDFVSLSNNAFCGRMSIAILQQHTVHWFPLDSNKLISVATTFCSLTFHHSITLHQFTLLHYLADQCALCAGSCVGFMNPALWLCQVLRHHKWFPFHLSGRPLSKSARSVISLCLSSTTTNPPPSARLAWLHLAYWLKIWRWMIKGQRGFWFS